MKREAGARLRKAGTAPATVGGLQARLARIDLDGHWRMVLGRLSIRDVYASIRESGDRPGGEGMRSGRVPRVASRWAMPGLMRRWRVAGVSTVGPVFPLWPCTWGARRGHVHAIQVALRG